MTGDGAKIWLNYTQEELDAQYEQRTLVPNADEYIQRNLADSAWARERMACRLDIPYGPTPDEVLDIFPASVSGAPIVVYIHGGAWTRMHKDHASYQAEAFVGAGANYVSVNFTLTPAVTLDELVRQNRAAIAWVYANAGSFGGDPARIYVAGHSSGAHVAGMMAVTAWQAAFDLPRNLIKGALLCSGTYEMAPARLSIRNLYLKLDEVAADRNSPIQHIPDDGCPAIIAYGDGDQKEFRRQSRAFAQAWRDKGLSCEEFDLKGYNHFDIGQAFNDPSCPFMAAMFDLMGLVET